MILVKPSYYVMNRIKNIVVLLIILIFIISWTGVTAYGIVHIWNRSNIEENKQFQISYIERLRERIKMLREEVHVLNSCIRWEIILSETLSSQEKAELDVIEASLRNKIQESFPNK